MPQYLILDTETSGLIDFTKPADEGPRVASLALLFVDAALELEREYHTLIRPDGWVMEEGATAVNGLTMALLEAEGIPILEALAVYGAAIDEERIVVAHNAQFDCKMMRGELRRAGLDDRFARTRNICTMRGSAEIVKVPPTNAMMATGRKGFKLPKLQEAYRHFHGEDFAGAHGALADAHACLAVFRHLMRLGAAPEPAVHYAKSRPEPGHARTGSRRSAPF